MKRGGREEPAVTLRHAAPTSRAMVVAVMVSMVAFLDSTVINLALPATEHEFGGGMALQQWVITLPSPLPLSLLPRHRRC